MEQAKTILNFTLAFTITCMISLLINKAIRVWSWTTTQKIMFSQTQNCKTFTHSEFNYLIGINCGGK